MRIALVLALITACERAPDSRPPPPAPPVAAKPMATAIPRPVEPRPLPEPREPAPPPAPKLVAHHRAAPEPVPTADELPAPPPTDDDYPVWWKARTGAERHRIARFCRANPTNYEPVCGGIGPLHVPPPPALLPRAEPGNVPPPKWDSREAWLAAMTSAQRTWVVDTCHAHYNEGDLCLVSTPLVVSFDGGPVAFAGDWPTARTPWIALDADRDGAIAMSELFGSWTPMPDGTTAHDGFAALALLDANHDGVIDAADPAFASLVLWADDGDRHSAPAELRPLARTIVSISLAAHLELRCDARDNCEGARAKLVWRDATGEHTGAVIDVSIR